MHPSVQSHLDTEIALLRSLDLRSRHQHRSQPFLSRIRQIARLSKLLRHALATESRRVDRLVHTLRSALVSAAASTAPIIQLHHFLPLQLSLLGVYARISALLSHLLDGPELQPNRTQSMAVPATEAIVLPRIAPRDQLLASPVGPLMTGRIRSTEKPVSELSKARKRKNAVDDIFASL